MSDNPAKTTHNPATQSGIFPRTVVEPEGEHEAPPPPADPPEYRAPGATTGLVPVVTEGEDHTADRDDDHVTGK